jgi:hypothetical protein
VGPRGGLEAAERKQISLPWLYLKLFLPVGKKGANSERPPLVDELIVKFDG